MLKYIGKILTHEVICLIAELRNSKEVQDLMTGILNLDNIEECYKFFDDLCTIHELKSIAQRFAVAKMLKENITYSEIGEKTGASTATISRVNRCLNYGDGGYNLILKRMENNDNGNDETEDN